MNKKSSNMTNKLPKIGVFRHIYILFRVIIFLPYQSNLLWMYCDLDACLNCISNLVFFYIK